MCKGQEISITGASGALRTGKIVEQLEDQVKVHYQGFPDACDEWVSLSSDRIKSEVNGVEQICKTQHQIKICLRDLAGKEQHLQMWAGNEVMALKEEVSRLWKIPSSFQRLLVGETTLENMQALSGYIDLCLNDHSDSAEVLLVMVLVCVDSVNAALMKLQDNHCSEKEALEILSNLGTLEKRAGSDVVKTVAVLVEDRRPSIRQAAIKTIVKIARRGDTDAISALSEALKEPSKRDAMVTSLKLIAEVGDEDAIFLMISYLQSHSERELGGQAETVVEFNSEESYRHRRDQKIIQALQDAGYDLERLEDYTFTASLLSHKSGGMIPGSILPQCVTSCSNYQMTSLARLQLHKEIFWQSEWSIGKPALDPRLQNTEWYRLFRHQHVTLCLSFLTENNVEICLAVLDVLGHVAGKGNQVAIAAVASCLEDDSDDVQWKAVEQLALVIAAGDHYSIMHAEKRLIHEDRRVRWAAQEALGQFIEKST